MTKYIDSEGYSFSFSNSGKLETDDSDVSPYSEREFLSDEIRRMIYKLNSKGGPLSTKELKTLYFLLKSANEIIS